ncbi:transposase, partial [Amycolatopsis speibonae]
MHHVQDAGAVGELSALRQEFYRCLTRRADALFELTDAVLCADGPVRSVAELSLAGEHRRGHGSGYAALARGQVEVDRLRTALTAVSLPRAADGRLVLAVDVTCWLRPEAHTRGACHGNRVSQRCTKIDSLVWRSEGTSSDSGHIVS